VKLKNRTNNIVLDLIDGNNWVNRAFYAVSHLDNGHGIPTNAIKGFNNMVMSLIRTRKEEGVDHRIAVAFDVPSKETFRYDLIENWVEENPSWAVSCGMVKPDDPNHEHGYKGNRVKDPDVIAKMHPQFEWIERILKAGGIHVIKGKPWEADDYLGSIAIQNIGNCLSNIQSRDKDFAQLIVKDSIHLIMPVQGNAKRVELKNSRDCLDHFGVKPNQIVEYLMLNGDKVDNIPGIPGVGVKTAVSILSQYGDLDTFRKHRKEVEGQAKWKKAVRGDIEAKGLLPPFALTRNLARIKTDIPNLPSLEDFKIKKTDRAQLKKLRIKLNISSLMA
jgi:DNA polymerase-1